MIMTIAIGDKKAFIDRLKEVTTNINHVSNGSKGRPPYQVIDFGLRVKIEEVIMGGVKKLKQEQVEAIKKGLQEWKKPLAKKNTVARVFLNILTGLFTAGLFQLVYWAVQGIRVALSKRSEGDNLKFHWDWTKNGKSFTALKNVDRFLNDIDEFEVLVVKKVDLSYVEKRVQDLTDNREVTLEELRAAAVTKLSDELNGTKAPNFIAEHHLAQPFQDEILTKLWNEYKLDPFVGSELPPKVAGNANQSLSVNDIKFTLNIGGEAVNFKIPPGIMILAYNMPKEGNPEKFEVLNVILNNAVICNALEMPEKAVSSRVQVLDDEAEDKKFDAELDKVIGELDDKGETIKKPTKLARSQSFIANIGNQTTDATQEARQARSQSF